MALHTQTPSLAVPLPSLFSSSSSFLSSEYTQIKCLRRLLLLFCPCLLSLQISCCFNGSSWASFSFHRSLLSPHIFLPSFCSQFSPDHTVFFIPLSFFFSSSPLRPSRWLVFVSLSLVAAAGSGLNNEITFTVGREAAHGTSPALAVTANTHSSARTQKCVSVHTDLNNENPDTCRERCLRWH